MNEFTPPLLLWFAKQGRHDLPWQQPATPYRVWLSEIMLQQTQVATVIPYFNRFMARFPDVATLAASPRDDVLSAWSGLGYYARARNLHRAAGQVRAQFAGELPQTVDELMRLPGIGRSTAGAILALAHNQPVPILDGNVKRVLTRYFAIFGWPGKTAVAERLWALSAELVPAEHAADYTQAVMDLGATVCTRGKPDCGLCPVAQGCAARRESLQMRLPERKQRQALPTREARFLVLQNERQEILLERRPPTGIWGGLWSLPECDTEVNLRARIEKEYDVQIRTMAELAMFRHTFSHFHLQVLPVRIQVHVVAGVRDVPGRTWIHPTHDDMPGVAVPVRKIIDQLYGVTWE